MDCDSFEQYDIHDPNSEEKLSYMPDNLDGTLWKVFNSTKITKNLVIGLLRVYAPSVKLIAIEQKFCQKPSVSLIM